MRFGLCHGRSALENHVRGIAHRWDQWRCCTGRVRRRSRAARSGKQFFGSVGELPRSCMATAVCRMARCGVVGSRGTCADISGILSMCGYWGKARHQSRKGSDCGSAENTGFPHKVDILLTDFWGCLFSCSWEPEIRVPGSVDGARFYGETPLLVRLLRVNENVQNFYNLLTIGLSGEPQFHPARPSMREPSQPSFMRRIQKLDGHTRSLPQRGTNRRTSFGSLW